MRFLFLSLVRVLGSSGGLAWSCQVQLALGCSQILVQAGRGNIRFLLTSQWRRLRHPPENLLLSHSRKSRDERSPSVEIIYEGPTGASAAHPPARKRRRKQERRSQAGRYGARRAEEGTLFQVHRRPGGLVSPPPRGALSDDPGGRDWLALTLLFFTGFPSSSRWTATAARTASMQVPPSRPRPSLSCCSFLVIPVQPHRQKVENFLLKG